MKKSYGDILAQEVSGRVAAPVATVALMTATPAANRVDGQLFMVGSRMFQYVEAATTGGSAPDAGSGRFHEIGGIAAGANLSVKGVAPTNVADLAAFVIAAFDGVTYAAGDLVLLANQTTAAQNGVYLVGTVAGTAPLTRVSWLPAGAIVNGGFTVRVNTGTLFANSNWFISTAGAITIGTTAHVWYPESVTQTLALPVNTGTVAVANVPILSATKTMVTATRVSAVTPTLTVMYALVAAATPGTVGTGTVSVMAAVAAGTVNVDDDSTLLISITNR